ncbi:hypothetical protein PLICRDRAFT_146181 [Plicaturopsis crispa FD-325 SS-3]|uniref:Thioredoxin domain-containing protein n=1 Tax=Plicaturopsis crispa FD-325 SS-3 TaxID=944288 RepID=A0A0C9SRJ8_PLICR|nr:hypothetical protein PLICRDRAFT_146181 [Plicaturopsis crispa FD-325 SS-3]
MTSFIASAAQVAHSAVAGLLSKAQVEAGATIPQSKDLKEGDPEKPITLTLTGKNIIIGVPGAFTPSCSSQVPAYIEDYQKFKAKGVKDIYVVAVNDAFVMKAWKAKLAPDGTPVRFLADDKGALLANLGLLFDASPLLGAPRSKRFAIIADGDKVTYIGVEEVPSDVTVTSAKSILAQL